MFKCFQLHQLLVIQHLNCLYSYIYVKTLHDTGFILYTMNIEFMSMEYQHLRHWTDNLTWLQTDCNIY